MFRIMSIHRICGQVDIRHMDTVTIDGEDAKDLDDAITIEKRADGGYELGVHIADVSHYVTENSALDREAVRRGQAYIWQTGLFPCCHISYPMAFAH